MSLEELRAKSTSLITTDGRFDDMTKDIGKKKTTWGIGVYLFTKIVDVY